jgi:hypothetical protein
VTKTVRSRFFHEIGEKVEGCTILETTTIMPPEPIEKRLGVYDYLVEVPPTALKATTMKATATRAKASRRAVPAPERSSFTRATPDERGAVIRRLPSR